MQSSKRSLNDDSISSGHERVPLDDSLVQDSPFQQLKENASPNSRQFRGTNESDKPFDSEKYRRELIRSLKASRTNSKRTRHSPSLDSHRLKVRSLGTLSIIVCTLIVTGAYANMGPSVWTDELTTVIKEVFSSANNKGSHSSPVAKDRTNQVTNGATDVVSEDTGDGATATHEVSANGKKDKASNRADHGSGTDPADSAANTEDTNLDATSDAVASTTDDSATDSSSPTEESTSATTTSDSSSAGGAVGGGGYSTGGSESSADGGGGGSSPPPDNSDTSSSGVVPTSAEPTLQSDSETDTTPPTIIPPPDVTVEATGALIQVELGNPTVSDLQDPSPTVSNDAPAGGFPVGTTTVTWTATDASGNTATAAQMVTISDTTPPTITVPSDITIEAAGPPGMAVDYSGESATDLVDGSLSPTCAPASGSMFALGITIVTCEVWDSHDNMYSGSFSITVHDTTPPTIIPPPDVTVEATGALTLVPLGSPAVNDTVDDSPTVTNNAPLTGFTVGTTQVTWIAVDNYGNTATATQLVTVVEITSTETTESTNSTEIIESTNSTDTTESDPVLDITPPTIVPPLDVTAEATGTLTQVELGTPTVSDLEDQSPTVTNDAPVEGFPVGTTTVTWTATDASGNTATAAQMVTVEDTRPPTIIPPADIVAEANGTYTIVDLGLPTVSDLVDSSPFVTNNGPADGFPVGNTTVSWLAIDASGNYAAANQLVTIVNSTTNDIVSLYDYAPSFAANGSSYYDIPHRLSLGLEKFSLAAWFKTSKDYSGDGMIVNKNGVGLETAGNNLNYGMWLDRNDVLRAGFEDSGGVNYLVVSSSKYNDGNWHYAVTTYDGSALALYVDNNLIGTLSTTAKPDTGGMNSYPLRIGANSQANDRYFEGEIDEVRLWNRPLTATELNEQYSSDIFSTEGLLVHMNGTGHNVMSSTTSTVTQTSSTYYTLPVIGGVKPTTVAYGSIVHTVCDTACTHTTIKGAIDALPSAGGKVILKGSKTFSPSSTISLRSNLIIEFEVGTTMTYSGTGKLFYGNNVNNVMFINPVISRSNPGDVIFFSNADTIIVQGGKITGVKGSSSSGFKCFSCTNILVQGGSYSTFSRPIEFWTMSGTTDGSTRNAWLVENTIFDSSIECVHLNRGYDMHAIGNDVRDCTNNGIDVGYNVRVEAKNNKISRAGYGTTDNAVGIHTDSSDTVILMDNVIEYSGTNGITLCGSDNNFVIGNIIRYSGQTVTDTRFAKDGHGIEAIACAGGTTKPDNNIIDQNIVEDSNDGSGVYIGSAATNSWVTNNVLARNEYAAITNFGSATTISDNTVS